MLINKCVLLVDENLPTGLIANTTAVLALSLGKLKPELIGSDLLDKDDCLHLGITTTTLPILRADSNLLSNLRNKLRVYEPELIVIDFTNAAQSTKNYQDYSQKIANTPLSEITYLGLALCGDKKIVNKFTGSLGLLR